MSTQTIASRDIDFVSPEFKKQAGKAIASIIGFIVLYFLMFALSLGLVALSCWGGLAIIMLRPSFYTILIGGGLVACGVMIFVFLVKFLFSTSKTDESDSIEIHYDDQPQLFEAIYALAKETGTSRPKKVFLSPDVNAAVFYNSSFWSMFLPIRKNLKIGLGLVNAVNVSELKAIIAHEFGHFSQRSMKLGSWVYQVNKIIHDMLYNNQGYAGAIQSIANIHGIMTFFASVTVKIVQGIQWVLRQMFKVVNKTYLGLSRQMEFHADLVAASVCGSNNIVSSLQRLEFADACYNTTINFCNQAWKEKKVVSNFYAGYTLAMERIADLNHLAFVNGMPEMEESTTTVGSRINYKNQWASHPTIIERKNNLEPYELTASVDTSSAWTLFINQDQLKEKLTRHLYRSIPENEIGGVMNIGEFSLIMEKQFRSFSMPECFGDFYDGRQIHFFDPQTVVEQPFTNKTFGWIFGEDQKQLPKKIAFLNQDIAVLNAIIKKEMHINSFDFEGRKYKAKEAAMVLAQLESELEQKQKELEELDQTIFRFFYSIAALPAAESLKQQYLGYFSERKEADHYLEKVNAMMEMLAPLYQGQLALENIQHIIGEIKQQHEPVFKKLLHHWMDKKVLEEQPALKQQAEKFLRADYQYFSDTSFFDNELNELNSLVHEVWTAITQFLFTLFRSITETEAKLLEEKEKQLVIR